MKARDVRRGSLYIAKVSGRLVTVQVVRPHPLGGWVALNTRTNREIRIRTAGRLRPRTAESAT